MVGKHQLVLDAAEWLKGMSVNEHVSDGGFGPATEGVNMLAKPGVLHAPSAGVDSDTDSRLSGEIIASAPDHAVFGGDNRLLVADDDTYYRYNGTKIIAAAYTGGTASTNQQGFTDIINYKGETYVTSKERIKRWTSTSTIADLASFTNTTYPHPALVYLDYAYYGDGNLLLRQTAAAGTPVTILTLPANEIIMALGIDPGSGKMLISTTSSLNISGTLQGVNKLHWYDGLSAQPDKTVEVGDIITSFQSVGSIVFVGYGLYIGYINGSGVQVLRRLQYADYTQNFLPYKHMMTSVGNTLYVADGDSNEGHVLAFGEVLGTQKIWYNALTNKVAAKPFRCIFSAGNTASSFGRKIGLSFDTTKFYTVDLLGVSTLDKLLLRTNRIHFPRPIVIQNIALEFAVALTSTNNITLTIQSENIGVNNTLVASQVGSSVYVVPLTKGFHQRYSSFWLQIEDSTNNAGLKRIIVYYDFQE